MLSFLVLLLVAYIVYLHAKMVRTGLRSAESPVFVLEEPQLPGKLQAMADRIAAWKDEGRITIEEREKLLHLLREDAARLERKPAP